MIHLILACACVCVCAGGGGGGGGRGEGVGTDFPYIFYEYLFGVRCNILRDFIFSLKKPLLLMISCIYAHAYYCAWFIISKSQNVVKYKFTQKFKSFP